MGTYFIKFEDASDLRRRLLESSKAGLHVLRSYQEMQQVRGEKLTQMNLLRQQLREVNLLLNRLEGLLPSLSEQDLALIRQQHAQPITVQQKMKLAQKEKMKPSAKDAPAPKPVPRPKDPNERIASAIAEIERRLGTLQK
jgi:hypothetical protein